MSRKVLPGIRDRRLRPRIPTRVLVQAGLVLFWARLGSLNALETVSGARFWKRWLRRPMSSVDTLGRVHGLLLTEGLREGLHHIYTRLKRNKVLRGLGGWQVAVLDGHEIHASYRRHCPGCLKRTIHSEDGDRVQFYHRQVALMLLGGKVRLLLDVEAQRPGEDEVSTALRLLRRVLPLYPRAFQVVLADGLYAQACFWNFLRAYGKHVLVVLKDERRDLYQDVRGLFELTPPHRGRFRCRECLWWDMPALTSWPQVNGPVRVLRSQETYTVRRQASGEISSETSEWIWATSLSPAEASAELLVRLGHARWDIENQGFNELANAWHADHVYKHDAQAIEAFTLVAFLAYNLFHACLALNLKPQIRGGKTESFWALLMAAEIYRDAGHLLIGSPP